MQEIPTLIPVVAAALIDRSGRVLMQRRHAHRAHGGTWEFPGGKVEPGETAEGALVREIAEELEIALDPEDLAPLSFASDPEQDGRQRNPHVVLLYSCRRWRGTPRPLDAAELGWFALPAFAGLPMPPLDRPLAQALVRVLAPAS